MSEVAKADPLASWRRQTKCERCGRPIGGNRPWQKFCSRGCRKTIPAERPEWAQNKSTGVIGAIGELRVSADLMAKGYEVFRAVSQACSCDLAILLNGRLYRVEVRTGVRGVNGLLSYPKNKHDVPRHDIMAVVEHSGDITYLPGLPDTKTERGRFL